MSRTSRRRSQRAKFANKATSREHNIFVVSEADALLPDLSANIKSLKDLGYAVFIFDEAAIAKIYGSDVDVHAAIFELVELASVLGKTQFALLMKDYGIQPLAKTGFYSVAACFVGVIKTLIGELAAKQQVATAA